MLSVKDGSNEFLVRFHHKKQEDGKISHVSECKIFGGILGGKINDDTMTPLASGVAKCHKNDNFCKALGRKHALTRAIAASGLEKSKRTLIWNAYLKTQGILLDKKQIDITGVLSILNKVM